MTSPPSPSRQRLPAYGANVIADRRAGRHGCNGLMLVALDWKLFEGRRDRVVLPRDIDAAAVHWEPIVVGLDVQILHWVGDEERATAAVREILPHCKGLHRRSFDARGEVFEVVRTALPPEWAGFRAVA